jgi:hypothetical protein
MSAIMVPPPEAFRHEPLLCWFVAPGAVETLQMRGTVTETSVPVLWPALPLARAPQ